jgi:hypothetical protein
LWRPQIVSSLSSWASMENEPCKQPLVTVSTAYEAVKQSKIFVESAAFLGVG